MSIDEAYLDLTDQVTAWEEAPEIAGRLQERVKKEIRLSASLGVATNKLVAKVASDRDKLGGLTVVWPGEEEAFLAPLPVRVLWGVGPVTAERLAAMGVTTVGELAGYVDSHREREWTDCSDDPPPPGEVDCAETCRAKRCPHGSSCVSCGSANEEYRSGTTGAYPCRRHSPLPVPQKTGTPLRRQRRLLPSRGTPYRLPQGSDVLEEKQLLGSEFAPPCSSSDSAFARLPSVWYNCLAR